MTAEEKREVVLTTDSYDYLIRIVLMGDARVGKSALVKRFGDDEFDEAYKPTIGNEFITKKGLKVDDIPLLVHIIDTSGQPRFQNLLVSYMRGFMTYFLVFDVTDRKSLDAAIKCHSTITNYCSSQSPPKETIRFLVANKTDCDLSARQVFTDEAKAKAIEFGMEYYETSAKSGKGVQDVMLEGFRRSVALYKKVWEAPEVVEGDKGKQEEDASEEEDDSGWCGLR